MGEITPERMAEAQRVKQAQKDAEDQKRWKENAPKRAAYNARKRIEAVAPELLSALEGVLKMLDDAHAGFDDREEIVLAKEVVAKARTG